jgi:hypothetical protein
MSIDDLRHHYMETRKRLEKVRGKIRIDPTNLRSDGRHADPLHHAIRRAEAICSMYCGGEHIDEWDAKNPAP